MAALNSSMSMLSGRAVPQSLKESARSQKQQKRISRVSFADVPGAMSISEDEQPTWRRRCWNRALTVVENGVNAVLSAKLKAAPKCRALNRSRFFQGAMLTALMVALCFVDIWILMDRPNNKDLDVILTVVLGMFLVELTVQSVGLWRSYVGTFFFYMDVMGAFSLLLDLSYLPILELLSGDEGGGDMSSNVVIMRAARIAKLGARAGRFTKLAKLLHFLPGMRKYLPEAEASTANQISAKLVTALSTRVSCLIIVMVMLMPLFSMWTYPELDWSMVSWMESLERISIESPGRVGRQMDRFGEFYKDLSYYPFNITAKPGASLPDEIRSVLPWASARGAPIRVTNVLRFDSPSFVAEFNFAVPHQMDSAMNLVLMGFVMVLMVGFSLVLSTSVNRIVLRPLENLLAQVRKMAATIFQTVTDVTTKLNQEEGEGEDEGSQDGEDDAGDFGSETAMLDKVVAKLNLLSDLSSNKQRRASQADSISLSDMAYMSCFHGARGDGRATDADDLAAEQPCDSVVSAQRAMVENAGLSLDLLNSWKLNPLELDKARNQAAAMFFVGPHSHGVNFEPSAMLEFLEAMEALYNKTLPYHSWFHAIDVTHGVFRLLHLSGAPLYMTQLERFGLSVSAVAHDVGHLGFSNAYLVQTEHELALRYNDQCPLENMHCSKLFETVALASCSIFGSLERAQHDELRGVCIDAILHTDTAQHFAMIKDVQMLYEVNSDGLEDGRQVWREDMMMITSEMGRSRSEGATFPPEDMLSVFQQPDTRRLLSRLVLHTADISNSMKPFRIARIWAYQMLEEFFSQGDQEKQLGIPVQPMNARWMVNRAYSQVGWIELLVAPLLFAMIRVLPPLEGLAEQMVGNAKTWHQAWIADTKPTPPAPEKANLEQRLAKMQQSFLDLVQ